MTTPPENHHREMCLHYLSQGAAELAQGDLLQAGEKYWGAVSQQLKAIADERNWHHSAHYLLAAIAEQLAEERERPEWHENYRAAELLHMNYYEDNLGNSYLVQYSSQAQSLIAQLEEIRLAGPPPGFSPDDEQRHRLDLLNGAVSVAQYARERRERNRRRARGR